MRHRTAIVWLACVASLVTGTSFADACWFSCKRPNVCPAYAHSVYCCVDGRWCKQGDYVTTTEATNAVVACVLAGHSAITVRYGEGYLVEGKPCPHAMKPGTAAVARGPAYTVHCCQTGVWNSNDYDDIDKAKSAYNDCLNRGYYGMLVKYGTDIGDPVFCSVSMPPGIPPGVPVPPKK